MYAWSTWISTRYNKDKVTDTSEQPKSLFTLITKLCFGSVWWRRTGNGQGWTKKKKKHERYWVNFLVEFKSRSFSSNSKMAGLRLNLLNVLNLVSGAELQYWRYNHSAILLYILILLYKHKNENWVLTVTEYKYKVLNQTTTFWGHVDISDVLSSDLFWSKQFKHYVQFALLLLFNLQ